MQKRHLDRHLYFTELATTSREFYIDYVNRHFPLTRDSRILEVGCGDGGNLLPFAEIGCIVKGIDQSEERIEQAKAYFEPFGNRAEFLAINFFDMKKTGKEDIYDVILVHDVIEHIADKNGFMKHLKQFVSGDGIIFWRFPAWQMPFGGHQQICKNSFCSKLPFIHLLPGPLYRSLLLAFGEAQATVDELMDIKRCGISIEKFEQLLKANHYTVIDRILWFINPHYKQKFKLKPRVLPASISKIKYFRNFFTTSGYYISFAYL